MRLDPKKTELDLGYLGKEIKINTYWNLATPQLIEQSILNQEGNLSPTGALLVKTGKYTGRSPKDKFIVDYQNDFDLQIDWGEVNRPFSPTKFDQLLEKILFHISQNTTYTMDMLVGAHPSHQRRVRVISEYAWSALFAHDLLISVPDRFDDDPDFTVIQSPSFRASPETDGTNSEAFVLVDFKKKIVLIGCTEYAGEIKKAIFSVMNRILPSEGVLPLHCSANFCMEGDTALFFGLSGTGKTTLSSDPDRFLIGDDEHGWTRDGVFNFEGGCYAKTINLNPNLEPVIWEASQKFGSVLENVVFDEASRRIDFNDCSLTENTRAAYPLENVAKRIKNSRGGHPNHIFFLSADAFGVLPPISRLTPEQAAYFFLSGYTAKLAGTERDLGLEPQATFSTCFGAPFMPLNPVVYANMLREKIKTHQARVWLVNTGWTGGPYGIGTRIKLPYTRHMISAALKGILEEAPSMIESTFHLKIPTIIPGVPAKILNPIGSWNEQSLYQKTAKALIYKFRENILQYQNAIDTDILNQL